MPFKRLRKPSRSRCESAGVFNERNVLQNVEVIQSVDVENAHGGNKEVNLRRDGLNGHHFYHAGRLYTNTYSSSVLQEGTISPLSQRALAARGRITVTATLARPTRTNAKAKHSIDQKDPSSILSAYKPSEPAKSITLSKCPVAPTNALFIIMWTKVMMLKNFVEETRRSVTDMTASTWTPSSALAGRRRCHIWQITYEHQNSTGKCLTLLGHLSAARSARCCTKRCSGTPSSQQGILTT